MSSRRASGTSATSRTAPPRCPTKYTGEVRRLGVDVEHDFQPIYVVNADKKAQVKKLKDLLADSDELFLATDEDREGEAIAWHLQEVLKPKVPVHRMVFHEITKDAIRAAVANPRELNTAHGRRPGDPPHPRPPLRLRGLAGPVEEGHAAACPPAVSSPSPPGSSSSGSASASPSAPPSTGT